eukprot:TRINITY_DN19593_c0_g1_i3.p1 TRINITY_DN19593_c0_g1~~TRINITY_DN19593_c0_g1_i3.p1  ORF type:complete len:263 (-),score=55.98 TRINITY_DN19593_c0_g1_i3:425-1213(-)
MKPNQLRRTLGRGDVPEFVANAFEDLSAELRQVPSSSTSTCVVVQVSDLTLCEFHEGCLTWSSSSSSSTAGGSSHDVLIAFPDTSALEILITEVRQAVANDELSRLLPRLLCEMALPAWAGGARSIEVTGAGKLAKALWAVWLAKESAEAIEQAREKKRQEWASDDLSSGWVVLPRVSPGIQERVAVFQQELDKLPKVTPQTGQPEPSASWMNEVLQELRSAAEQFNAQGCQGDALPQDELPPPEHKDTPVQPRPSSTRDFL